MADFNPLGSPVRAYKDVPPLLGGEDPFSTQDDGRDADRVRYVQELWASQNHLLRDRDRTIEQHIRMLCGQQWSVWSELRGRWVDLTDYLSDDERRWRYLPVINRLLHWYMLLHARMTENPPILTFQAAGGDRVDAQLAEVMDAIWKYLWYEVAAGERLDDLFAWLIPAGEAYMKSRIDANKGDVIPFQGPAAIQIRDPNTGQVMDQVVPNAPYDRQGNALLDEFGNPTGEPHIEYEGMIALDVLTPMQVRGTWGQVPWHEKPWHIQRSLVTPAEIYEQFGRDVEPTIRGSEAEEAGTMRRLLLGSGYFGAAGSGTPGHLGADTSKQEYVEVFEAWFAPSRFPGMERTDESPGGRLLIVAGKERMRDGPRYAKFKYTSPIRRFAFVNVKGRQSGTSPEEMMVGPQKSYNRIMSQILQHATIVANPLKVIDTSAGIQEEQITNRPGQNIFANLSGITGDPIRFVDPPSLSRDVWRSTEQLRLEMNELGNISGSEGTPPHMEASGELVKELRFNSDRFVGPTLRRAVQELTRMAEDWKVMIPLIWDQPKILRVVGEDSVPTTLTVLPTLFLEGNIDVRPDVESMLPEGRGERQARVWRMWKDGAFGDPISPEAREMYLSLAQFPHLGRASMPGGMDRVTAEQNIGRLMMGAAAEEIPVFEWYDHTIHLQFTERFMKSPEFLKLAPETVEQFVIHRQRLQIAIMVKAQQDAMLAMTLLAPQQQLAARSSVAAEGAALDQAEEEGIPVVPGAPDRGPTSGYPVGGTPGEETASA